MIHFCFCRHRRAVEGWAQLFFRGVAHRIKLQLFRSSGLFFGRFSRITRDLPGVWELLAIHPAFFKRTKAVSVPPAA